MNHQYTETYSYNHSHIEYGGVPVQKLSMWLEMPFINQSKPKLDCVMVTINQSKPELNCVMVTIVIIIQSLYSVQKQNYLCLL